MLHSKRSRGKLARLRRAIGIFTFGENSAENKRIYVAVRSPTARKYSRFLSPSQAYGSVNALFSSGTLCGDERSEREGIVSNGAG